MRLNLVGPFVVNAPFGTEIAFAKGLRRLGHEVVEVDPNVDKVMGQLDMTADATVIFKTCCGAEWRLNELRHPKIVYQPDDARFPHIRQMMLMMREVGVDLLLSFDGNGAEVARTMGYRAAETLLLTADDELYCPSPEPVERNIDVSFIGSLGDPVAHASRRRMCQIVQSEGRVRGWRTVFTQCQDIPTVLDIYRRSRVVLNHATDVGQPFGYGFGFQCRHFEVGMTNTPLLTNELLPDATVGRLDGNWNSFNSEQDLINQLEIMLSGGPSVEALQKEMPTAAFAEIQRKHLPQHRAAKLVEFIEKNV